jgi:hypothetical protein
MLQPALRGGALRTIEQREYVTNGPLQLVQGNFGTIARIPIFIQNSTLNETFRTNKTCEQAALIRLAGAWCNAAASYVVALSTTEKTPCSSLGNCPNVGRQQAEESCYYRSPVILLCALTQ